MKEEGRDAEAMTMTGSLFSNRVIDHVFSSNIENNPHVIRSSCSMASEVRCSDQI